MERRTDAKEYAAAVGELSGVNLTVAIRTAKADKTSTEYEAFKRQRQAEKEKVDKTATAYEAFKQQRQAEREREEKERQKLKPQTTTKKKDIDLERRPHGKRRLLQDFCRYGGSTNRFERSFLVGFGSGKVTVRWFLAVLERFLEVVRSKKPYKTTLYGCTVVYGGLYGLKTLIKQRCTVVRWIFPFFLFCIFYSQF